MNNNSLVGQEIDGRYRIDQRIGAGGMGTVYKARHLLLDVDIALKVINPALATTEEMRERFLREAKAATELSHTNIVTVRDVGQFEDRLFFTMDLVQGRTLREVLDQEGRIPVGEAVEIMRQLLSALEEAHAHGMLHRDLKPGNVMLDERGRAQVLDFGLVKWIREDSEPAGQHNLTATGFVIGTIGYMAPEQITGDPIDIRTDLYAASVVLYEMISGRAPHEAPSTVKLINKILLEEPEALPGPVGEVVMRGLARDLDDRPATATEFREQLDEALSRIPVAERTQMTALAPQFGRQIVVDGHSRKADQRFHESKVFRFSAVGLLALAILGGGLYSISSYLKEKSYESLIVDARAAIDEGRYGDAVEAFRNARDADATAEAILGLQKANLKFHRSVATQAESNESWQEAINAWNRARQYAESESFFDQAVRRARVQLNFQKTEAMIVAGDGAAAKAQLLKAQDLLENRSERDAYLALTTEAEAAYQKQIDPAGSLRTFVEDFRTAVRGIDPRIDAAQKELDELGEELATAEDVARKQAAEKELNRLTLIKALQQAEVLTPGRLASLTSEADDVARRHEASPSGSTLSAIEEQKERLQAVLADLEACEKEVSEALILDENGRSQIYLAVADGDPERLARWLKLVR